MSARRSHEVSSDIVRYEGSNGVNNRANRWPTLSQTQIPIARLTTADEKLRRSQVLIKSNKIYFSFFYHNL